MLIQNEINKIIYYNGKSYSIAIKLLILLVSHQSQN